MKQFLFLFTVLFVVCSCSAQSTDTVSLKIQRFDVALFQYLENTDNRDVFSDEYRPFLDVFGQQVLQIGSCDSTGFEDRLQQFFSEPALRKLYADEIQLFSTIESYEKELAEGMALLLTEFPGLKLPFIYMHVSGWNQNVVVTDSLLSISADKYLGADYALYMEHFYDYERQMMSPDRIVPDYLLGFLMANFPFEGKEDVLLDRMLYEGKLRYILSRIHPERNEWEYVGYTKEEYAWCQKHQSRIWKTILEHKHLYTSNYFITSQYLNPAPYTAFLPAESPGRVGLWVGYQIIVSLMKHHPEISLLELMQMRDVQELLKLSRYKP